MDNLYTQILDGLERAGLILLILSVIVWAIRYVVLPKSIKILGIYLLLNLVVQIVADQLWQRSMNNLYLLHLITLLDFVCLSFFFKEIYLNYNKFKEYFYYIIGTISTLLILNSIFLEPLDFFNSNARILVQSILITYVIMYLFDAFGKVDFSKREEQVISLICFAILIYYAGSLSTYLFSQFYSEEIKEGLRPIWVINGFLTALFQFILLMGIIRLGFRPKIQA